MLVALSKILEKMEYFVSNNLFSDCQYGYLKIVSTVDALLNIVNYMIDCYVSGDNAVGFF